jgi:deoxyribodipyrimidine photo-lyase
MRHIVWLRQELRTADNPALYTASQGGHEVAPVFVWPGGDAMPGAASRWWLHGSLLALSTSLEKLGSRLVILTGEAARVLPELARDWKADAVFWSRAYDPEGCDEEDAVEQVLRQQGTECRIYAGANHLLNPADVWNKSGGPFKVFTPFYKHASTLFVDKPLPCLKTLVKPKTPLKSTPLAGLGLEPEIDWADGLRNAWCPGEAAAAARLDAFIGEDLKDYGVERDIPGHDGTSKLSPHLHFGELSPRSVYYAIRGQCDTSKDKALYNEAEVFLRQLYWREFAHHLLHHFPHMVDKPMYPEYEKFPWRKDKAQLRTWQRGRTGYPIVDAGMRELWTTGWMHNRVRMIAGSFLVKDLLLPWQSGAAWFWATLVDADKANNTLGWQGVGGCGPDAAPYFRIFNPVLQSKRFDPKGLYIKHWVPELARLQGNALHAPWTASPEELRAAGVTLGNEYPQPMVDHGGARERALMAYNGMKSVK